jgi:hypothetical protein
MAATASSRWVSLRWAVSLTVIVLPIETGSAKKT